MDGNDVEPGTVGVQWEGAVAVIELQRDTRRNALDTGMCRAVHGAVEQTAEQGARAAVVTGQGSAFCAGADLSGDVYKTEFPAALDAMLRAVEDAPMPVVAAVDGPAVGAGTQLAMACDLRVVGEGAWFQIPVVKVGLAVHGWTIRKLSELAGGGPARGMLMAAERIPASRAVEIGLANRSGGLEEACAWATEIAGFAPLSLRHLKAVFNEADADASAVHRQNALFEAAWTSEDRREAARARREGRPPRFQGE